MADLIALVDKATSEYLIQTDWTVNLQICDTLNREGNPMLCREVVRQTTKRMKEKKSRIALFALELLETLVKNCEGTHSFVGGNECQAEIIKLIQNKKTKDTVKERALELVQYWADSFSARKDLPHFNQTHNLLRRAGITFPPRRKDEPPLVFKNAPAQNRASVSIPAPNTRSESSSNLGRDMTAVQENVNLAMEMLAYTNPEEEDPASNEILKELIATCKEAMPNVRSTIESANFSSDAQMVSLLALNDELVKVQEMYDDLIARRHIFVTHGPQPKSQPQNDILDLATAFGTLNTQAPPLHPPTYQSATSSTTSTPTRPLDEFDFLSGPPSQNNTPTKPAVPYPAPPSQVTPPKQPQYSNVNPFFDTTPPKQNVAADEFDLFAQSRHNTPPPVMSAPLQPVKTSSQPTQGANLYFPPSNTGSNPYGGLAVPPTSSNSLYSSPTSSNPYSVPLAPSPTNHLYNAPLATSPTNIYNAPLATSPNSNPFNTSAPLATSPTGSLYGRPPGPAAGGAPFFPSYPSGTYSQPGTMQPLQPMQHLQPIQPMQPMQPMQPQQAYNPYNQPSVGQNSYGGYRPQ